MQLPQGGCRGTCWFEEDTGIAVTKRVRRNEEIDAAEVRVIDSEGEQKGVMSVPAAIELAKAYAADPHTGPFSGALTTLAPFGRCFLTTLTMY